ncbi:hypothetical protein N7466_001208 [Penicillium verhagenii]|uniref:uncharacterized protein n=1 Tax=Penicillium verhagenii TaxID=1562060 RepID=UPI0025458075|nr:uncharacterized protein N7466_001208 [Penicillium verhagenii]KAJ5948193.1 hypothetical protein N7466_001208 [Penicillium verhagenii]
MRTLMLHGHATSAFIFKAQTIPFRSKLDKSFTFDFVDGPYSCPPPRGLSTVVSTAYGWIKNNDIDSIREAVQWLVQYIEVNGPYDCICCFSKASAVVMAMLMDETLVDSELRERITPGSIIFINGSIEYPFLEELGMPISAKARQIKYKTEQLVKQRTDGVAKLARTLVKPGVGGGLWDDTSKLMHNPKRLPPVFDCFGLDFTFLPQNALLSIPSVHIVGAKDPIWPSGVQLAYLCDPAKRQFYDHQGGHDLPRTPQVGGDIAAIFKELSLKMKR